MHNHFQTNRPHALLIGLFLAWGAVVAICCVFISRIDEVTGEEIDRYLLEISNGVSATITSRIDNTFLTLKSISVSYGTLRNEENGLAVRHLRNQAALFGFKRLAFTDSEGNTVFSDGHTVSLRNGPNVQRAFAGEEVFVRVRKSPVDGSDGILYARPVVEHGRITGVISAWSDRAHIQGVLQTPVFNGKGHFHILDPDGITFLNPNYEDDPDKPNFFDMISQADMLRSSLDQMKKSMDEGLSGRIDFVFRGLARSVCYVPLRSGSYLVSVVPTQVASAQFNTLLRESLLIVGAIVTVFTILVVLLFLRDRRNAKRLAAIAFIDPVTGGMTRNRFQLEALPILKDAAPHEYSLVSANIRQFKLVNDILGGETGDRLLRQIHDCLKEHLIDGELVCRDYADDFVLLVTTKSRLSVLNKIDAVTAKVNQFLAESGCRYKLRLSFGVYEIEDTALPMVSLIDHANIARKSAKAVLHGHLSDCVFYSDLERQQLLKTKDIENKMEEALANEDFIVYLQPKIELERGAIVGAEALVRWQDMDTGIIPPGDFIPCFETNGFIIKLDLYIFERICQIMRGWLDAGLTPVPVSVNLSRAHLLDPDFLDRYVAIRDRYGIPHGLLEVELTESLVFENFETLTRVVNDLHANGFTCSLDDFGCGYSSLNLLKDLNVDTLKLDGAFWMSPDADNQREKDIIASVVALAGKLGMRTVSEGVETEAQLEFLRQVHCDMVQGYVFSKPVPPDVFEEITYGKTIG